MSRHQDGTLGTAICNLADQVRELSDGQRNQAELLQMMEFAFHNPIAMRGLWFSIQAVAKTHDESPHEIIGQVRNNLAIMAEAIDALGMEVDA